MTPDSLIENDDWSDLAALQKPPFIDHERLVHYREQRLRDALKDAGCALGILFSPVSLRYAADYRNYALFQAHIPSTYLFIPAAGAMAIHGAYDPAPRINSVRPGRAITCFDGGPDLNHQADLFANDVLRFLDETGADTRRIAVEYVNPSVTQALMRRDLKVIDCVGIVEAARMIKSQDEVNCMRWAIAVAEHGIHHIKRAMQPGVSELQLWALLNYTNVANNGDWHEGRMLASGPRTNPWLQEASERRIEAGDLVALDTDMVGPFGYCADISRTFFCGPGKPSTRQRELYQLAVKEIEHNLKLVHSGRNLRDFQKRSFAVPSEYHEHAYTCVIHGVGMCDEFPQVKPIFRNQQPADAILEAGMVICVESFMGAIGEPDGVKLEQQVLVNADGYEMLSTYPLEEKLLT